MASAVAPAAAALAKILFRLGIVLIGYERVLVAR